MVVCYRWDPSLSKSSLLADNSSTLISFKAAIAAPLLIFPETDSVEQDPEKEREV